MSHPYKNLPEYCYWPKAMSFPAPGHIDPVTRSEKIKSGDLVATMGSCFAQHIAKHISKSGLKYFVPEIPPPHISDEEALQRGYNVFSARYGNVYTVRQALQLYKRAFGLFSPVDYAWERPDGRWVDPFRPQIEPNGFDDAGDVKRAADHHLSYVREIFTKSNWLVFTLGLTEGWISKIDGAVYPTAPGVAGGVYDADKYAFENFTVNTIISDLCEFLDCILEINPKIKFLLTVSPVSLMATFEQRHVLVSTVASKSILRVVADEVEKKYPEVYYFPSYEIITSPANSGLYYEDDLRQVSLLGVAHVMRVFSQHFLEEVIVSQSTPDLIFEFESSEIVCDEEILQKDMPF